MTIDKDMDVFIIIDREKLPEGVRDKFPKDLQDKLAEILQEESVPQTPISDLSTNPTKNTQDIFTVQKGSVIGNIYKDKDLLEKIDKDIV